MERESYFYENINHFLLRGEAAGLSFKAFL